MTKSQASLRQLAGGCASQWRPGAAPREADFPAAATIAGEQARPLIADTVLWDIWPLQLDDGMAAPVAGGSLWIVLSAPRGADPDDRHDHARMRLLFRTGAAWHDCGDLLPEGFAPGNREWSGSARLEPDSGRVTLWFTAAGRRGAPAASFEQRLFHATGRLDLTGALPRIGGWGDLTETVDNDGSFYADLAVSQGVAGAIKGFRDPYWFRDPADGQGYILFTGSQASAASRSDFDGVIGIAAAGDADGMHGARLLPPLIEADSVVNELERPHMLVQDGRYYLFWSSQRRVFAPDYRAYPTGLYGMVAPALAGPWKPLNGTGLVLANPPAEPRQAYAWQVVPGSLEVIGFVDYWGLQGRDIAADPALKAAQFGGTVAPPVRIALDGAASRIVAGGA